MLKGTVVSALALASILAGTSALQAQCGSTLSCTTAPAYTVSDSGAGEAFLGKSTYSGTSATYGVEGLETNSATGSAGVVGYDAGECAPDSQGVGPAGVIGASVSYFGVIGYTNSNSDGVGGVAGYTYQSGQCSLAAAASGYLAYKTSGGTTYAVYGIGNTGATGTKSFIEPHPTDASKEIRYVSLEGPEAGTYFRGSGRTVNGSAIIEVPESFRMVTAEAGMTVVVTPTGDLAQIAAISKSLDRIVIRSSKDVTFDYVVNGVRKAFQDFQAIAENDDFIPLGPKDNRFFAFPAESQRRLVATGIYLPDGSVNLAKAHEMGWDRNWTSTQEARNSAAGFLRFAGLAAHP